MTTNKPEKLEYEALIHTRNFRDVNTTVPKILLTNIMQGDDMFRDHCYVNITPTIQKFLNNYSKKSNKEILISFKAHRKSYGLDSIKQTLTSITHIKVLW